MTHIFALSTVIGFVLLGQAEGNIYQPLLNLGLPGVLLYWFMFRVEKGMKEMRDAVLIMARTNLINTLGSGRLDKRVREECESLMSEIDKRKPDKTL